MMSLMIDATNKAYLDGYQRGVTEAVSLFTSILKTGEHRQKLDCVDIGCFESDSCDKCICCESYWDNLAEDIAAKVKCKFTSDRLKGKAV